MHQYECVFLQAARKRFPNREALLGFYKSTLYPRLLLQAIIRLEAKQDKGGEFQAGQKDDTIAERSFLNLMSREFP